MRWVNRISTISLSLVMAGCLGGYQPGSPGSGTPGTPGTTTTTPGTGPNAEALFISNVQPFISTECAACHATDQQSAGPKFLGANGAYYGQLVNDSRFVNNKPESSYLITHKHLSGPGMGVDPSPAQAMSIIQWITQENMEHTLPAPPASAMAPLDELAKFAACMNIDDYTSSGMADIWRQNVNGNGGNCSSCHQNGEHDVTLSVTPQTNFDALKDLRHLLRLATADINMDGSLKDVIGAQRFYMAGSGQGTHPTFPPNGTYNVQGSVDTFFQDTYNRYKAGNCGTMTPDGGAPPDGGI